MDQNKFNALVAEMRTAKKNYFATAAMARKSKAPEYYGAAKEYLDQSKTLEAAVDAMLASLTTPESN